MQSDLEKYLELKRAIHRVHHVEDVSKVLLLEDRIEYTKVRIRRSSAMMLGVYLMEQGLLEFGELKVANKDTLLFGDTTTFETALWVVHPGAMETHKKELEATRLAGREEAINEIHEAGVELQRKGDYGPMMGRTLIDQAARMREKSDG